MDTTANKILQVEQVEGEQEFIRFTTAAGKVVRERDSWLIG